MEEKTRIAIEYELSHELGNTERIALLIDYIKEMWETMDLLRAEFGCERAHAIITAPAFVPEREVILV